MGIFNSLIAYVSNAMPLSTSTGYEACAISNPSSCYTKVRSFFSIVFIYTGVRLLTRALQI